MKIAVLGAGAMGSVVGGLLSKAGNQVTLVDVSKPTIEAINSQGLLIEDKAGNSDIIHVRATDRPAVVGTVDLLVVFVKCYHTESAVRTALPMIGPGTTVLSLQNGWGNGPRIANLVGKERLLLGVCYHSATVLAPGRVLHAGKGMTFMGELDGRITDRLSQIAATFTNSGVDVAPTSHVIKEIWSKLALNVVTLPTSATLRITADRLLDSPEMERLMKELLKEVVNVAAAQSIPMDFDERWQAITGLLGRLAPNTRGSMLQDVEKGRRTEIDVINGAIVEAGQRYGLPTPFNEAMLWTTKALEASFR